MSVRIVFVCLGNICRSPIAEAVFRAYAADAGLIVEVDSAGTGGWHVGEAPDSRAQIAGAKRGYDLSALRARQITQDDFSRFDLVLAMDESNLNNLRALAPCGAGAKVALFTEYARVLGAKDIPDPYYNDRFDVVLDMVEQASQGLIDRLT